MAKTTQELIKDYIHEKKEIINAPYTNILIGFIKSLILNIKGLQHLPSYIWENPEKAFMSGLNIIAIVCCTSVTAPPSIIETFSSFFIFKFASDDLAGNHFIKATAKFINSILAKDNVNLNKNEIAAFENAKDFCTTAYNKMFVAIQLPVALLLASGLGNIPILNFFSAYMHVNILLKKAKEMGDEKAKESERNMRDNENSERHASAQKAPVSDMNWANFIKQTKEFRAIAI